MLDQVNHQIVLELTILSFGSFETINFFHFRLCLLQENVNETSDIELTNSSFEFSFLRQYVAHNV